MKSQGTLSKIMELLNLQDEIKLESMKLENGTVIEAEAFEANQEVFIITENEEKIAMPVGEYALEDGRILVVVEEGVIAEVKEVQGEEPVEEEAPAEAPVAEEEMAEEPQAEVALTEARVREIVAEMLSEMMPKEEEMAEEPKEELAEEVKEEEVDLSADEPATKPIKHNPETKSPELVKFSKGGRKDTLSRIFDKLG